MELKQLFTDDSAVSPVIGVILMVAITVILAAVIGTFVLGLGDQVQATPPNAQFSTDYTENSHMNFTHEGGDAIVVDRLTFTNGSNDVPGTTAFSMSSGEEVSAGDEAGLDEGAGGDFMDGDTVRLVWEAEGGGNSQTIAEKDTS